MAKYEVVLSTPARRAVFGLRTNQEKDELADCLSKELDHGPNADHEYTFPIGSIRYTATPLTFRAWTAVHRRLTPEELDRLEQDRKKVQRLGFLIHDFLRPHSAFELGPHAGI